MPDNYGAFKVGRRIVGAHRFAWIVANGPIPEGQHILHHCDNPPCVRPSHLFLGTAADNAADRGMKGRSAVGARLTADDVRAIRRATGTQSAIARQFGVNQSEVCRIRRKESWAWLT